MSNENELVNEIEDLELDLSKKKKKQKKVFEKLELDESDTYPYGYLLRRLVLLLEKSNEKSVQKNSIACPRLSKYGSKKTVFENCNQISMILHRDINILKNYFSCELCTEISLNDAKQMIIKGLYKQEQIEMILRKFIENYVLCGMCKKMDTLLEKDNKTRLYFIFCNACGASRTVETIKQGFTKSLKKKEKEIN